MSSTNTHRPPEGWELQIEEPDYAIDVLEPVADNYQSERRTKDGETFVYGYWNANDGLGIVIDQHGSGEITLPSPWAARQLAELLFTIAGEAQS